MYTHRSHMSVVEYTCVFHRPDYDKIIKITKLRQVRINLQKRPTLTLFKTSNLFKFENLPFNLNQSYKHERRPLVNYQTLVSSLA